MIRRANDRNGRGQRSAAAAVELACVLPFLAFVFAAAVDFGRVHFATQTLTQAARNGASYASGTMWVAQSLETNEQAARAAAVREGRTLNPPLTAEQVTVDIAGESATVTVNYELPLMTGMLISRGRVSLKRSVTMAIAPRPGR